MSYDIFSPEVGLDAWLHRDGSTLGTTTLGDNPDVTATGSGGGTLDTSPITSSVAATDVAPGELGALIGYNKKSFTDTNAGFLMGLDKDGIYKWIIGNSTSSADWAVTTAGTFTIVGAINVSAGGTIAGFEVGADYIRDVANSFGLASTVTAGDDVRFWAGNTFANRAIAPFRITEAGAITGSNITITGGSVVTSVLSGLVALANTNVSAQGWTQTCAFTVSSATVVAWGAGTFTTAAGTAYAIGASNTGAMAAKTYIYLDIGVSTTAYQVTTTASTAVGAGKVLVAIAQNNITEATFMLLNNNSYNIDAANIVAGSITANEIAASTITAGKLSVTTLSSIAADLGTITAGSITAGTATIGGFSIGADYIRDAANSMGMASTVTVGDDVRFWAGDTFANRATAPFKVTEAGAITATSATITGALTTGVGSSINGTYLTALSVSSAAINLASQSWTTTIVFSVTDADTIAWGAGNIVLADGTTYAINASNTGNMVARTYIYLDIAVSSVNLQLTTTASTAVGNGKKLIATAVNGTNEASYFVYSGAAQQNLDGANIVAHSLTANEITALTITAAEIAANTITAGKLSVATLSAITADLGTITAGSIGAGTATIGGFSIGATTITATNLTITSGAANTANISVGTGSNLAGMNSANGSTDIAFWAGDTFANRATAPFRVTAAGSVTANTLTLASGGTFVNINKISTVTTQVAIANTNVLTTLLSVSIPGGTLRTSNAIRAKLYFSVMNVPNPRNVTLVFKFGATTIATLGFSPPESMTTAGYVEFTLFAVGATNSQKGFVVANFSSDEHSGQYANTANTYGSIGSFGTAAEDSTGALTLSITVQHSANAGATTMDCATVEVIQ